MNIWMRRGLKGLEPFDDAAMDSLRKLKQKDIVRCEISKPRNVAFHRKFFAMLNLVWSSAGDWASVEDLLEELKYRLGYFEKRKVIDKRTGEVFDFVRLKSISFAAMDDLQFDVFYESAMRELCVMAGGIEYEVLREEVMQQLAAA